MAIKEFRFWMVWNPAGRPPTHRHDTRASADAEAERLANANPGQRFYVLKSMAGLEAASPKLRKVKMTNGDGIPF